MLAYAISFASGDLAPRAFCSSDADDAPPGHARLESSGYTVASAVVAATRPLDP
jgi:hypothetical protein